MKALSKWLLEHLFIPILLIILTPTITVIASQVFTGDSSRLFAATPVAVWVILAVTLIPWTGYAIRHRIKHIRRENWSLKPLKLQPREGWETINKIEHAGVIWQVRVPIRTSTIRGRETRTLDDLDVQIPPRCPDCGTKLDETKSLCFGYVWECVECGFRKRNRDHFSREERRVIKRAERWFEEAHIDDGGIQHL